MTTAEAMTARRPSPPRGGGGVRGTRAASRNRPRARRRGGHGGAASADGTPTSLSRIRKSAAPAAGAPPLHLERAGQGPISGGLELLRAEKRARSGSAAPRNRPRGGHGGAGSAGGPPTSLSRIRRSAAPVAGAPLRRLRAPLCRGEDVPARRRPRPAPPPVMPRRGPSTCPAVASVSWTGDGADGGAADALSAGCRRRGSGGRGRVAGRGAGRARRMDRVRR
ncbi:serine/arginine repetitive matrix protein 3-like [Panicum virgatum]|uniref:serine/arginine repetitive matrix protein 3-like n=1 Tax=Panicum virgatum TaxID=38727 RepID=UPI0019D63126|nr:serine/arginine repetitive matrix protein 3-like [Panicum virgatum]